MKKKILFIQPTIYDDKGDLVKKRKLYFVGMAYPLLAAMLPPDWECEICLETIEDVPFDTDASVIGCGGMGHAARRAVDLAKEFRKRGKTVIMGGPMASLAPELAAEYFDSVVVGDAEEVWAEVVRDLEQARLRPLYRQQVTQLSTPLPRYDLILDKNIGDFLPVQAGRGCPNSCKFCSIYCMYRGRYLKRDIGEVIRDIRHVKQVGFKKFLLIDDNIVADEAYMTELCREIRKMGMEWMSQCSIDLARNPDLLKLVADSGCTTLSFGLESLNQESLDRIDKSWCKPADYPELLRRITDAGIDVASEMIVGIDADTPESLRETVDFIVRAKIVAPKFYIMTPIPGTDLYRELLEAGRIVDEDVFSYTPSRAVIRHPHMSTEEITELYWEIYRRLYTPLNILRRTVFTSRFLKKPRRGLFYLMVNLYYRYQIGKKIAPNIL